MNAILVGLGGFIGAASRYLITLGMNNWLGKEFPYGTLTANILGGFLIGVIMELSKGMLPMSPQMRLFLTTGIMGGLTTFSTFGYETIQMFLKGSFLSGIVNVSLNLFLVLFAVYVGQTVVNISQSLASV